MSKYIWLFGENVGATANNNSFYFWLESLKNEDEIEKYFVIEKTKRNVEIIKKLPPFARKFVCWRNSLQHFKLYKTASMYFVTLSYRDVRPEKLFFKNVNFLTKKPVIYLQHGTLAIKRIGYDGTDYNNNMFRFVYYNKMIKEQLIKENGFNHYQLYYGEFHPRYKELVKQFIEDKHNNLKILFFPTWREYFGKNVRTETYLRTLKKLVKDEMLNEYLSHNNVHLKFCLHAFFSKELLLKNEIKGNENIEIVSANEVDVLTEIATNDVCITDYSSVGFDFTLLGKPVILFQPDREEYLKKRKLYCTVEELANYSIDTVGELVDVIINRKYGLNQFFTSRLPDKIDFEYIKNGEHIQKMYRDFYKIQINNILILGYNFYGVGGTVSATHALAEGFLEKGYLVTLLSLKQHANVKGFAKGLNMNALMQDFSKRKTERIKRVFSKFYQNKGYFKYDTSNKNIPSYCGVGLNWLLRHETYKYYISTRESIHLFLDSVKEINNNQKFYFYHTDASVVDFYFPGIMKEVVNRKLDNSIFVTNNNRIALAETFGFKEYNNYLVIGNSLPAKRLTLIDQIDSDNNVFNVSAGDLAQKKYIKKRIRGVFLLRLTKEREEDIDRLIDFAVYLKKHDIDDIRIDIYGAGDYSNELRFLRLENKVEDIIFYKGKTDNPRVQIKKSDFVVDFSKAQSFGMVYLEAIFNGKMIFCRHNNGSDEVLRDCPECFFDTNEELLKGIRNLPTIDKNKLCRYKLLAKRFSREAICDKFLQFADKVSLKNKKGF